MTHTVENILGRVQNKWPHTPIILTMALSIKNTL